MSENYVSTENSAVVPFSDDETVRDDELLTDDAPAANAEEHANRKKKRTERITGLINEGRKSAEEVAALKAEQQALRSQIARLEGYVTAQSPQRAAAGGGDPYKAELDRVRALQSETYKALQAELNAGELTEERSRYYEARAAEIEDEKSRINTERVLATRMPEVRQEQAKQVWVQKYPDMYKPENRQAFQFASATSERRKALGEEITAEVVDEIMQEAMTTFKIGPKTPPTRSERSRMSGMPSSGGGGGNGGSNAGITMTPDLRKMARALYSDLPEEEAIKKWANTAGKELRKQKVL